MSFSAAPTESFDVIVVGGAEAHGFIIRFWRRVGLGLEVEVLQGVDGVVGVAPAA